MESDYCSDDASTSSGNSILGAADNEREDIFHRRCWLVRRNIAVAFFRENLQRRGRTPRSVSGSSGRLLRQLGDAPYSVREWSQHSPQLQDGGWTRSSLSWNKFGKIQRCQMTKSLLGHLVQRLTLDSALYSKDSSSSSIELPQTLGSAVPMPGLFLKSFAVPPNMLYINLQLNFWSDPCLLGNGVCYWNGWKLQGYEPQTELQGRWFSCKDKRLWRRWRFRQGHLRRRPRRRRCFFHKLGSYLLASVLHKMKYALIAGAAATELPCSTLECTRSGPKSGVRYRTASTRKFPYMLPILMLLLCLQQADGVKVGVDSTVIPGASAKHCGGTVNMPGSDAQAGPHATVIKKKAYRRALNRALQNGSTRYRGRIMTAAQASWYSPPRLVPQRSEPGPHRRTSRSRRNRVLSHNFGGVCTATYDNFCCWLENCSYDVILLQEVHFWSWKVFNAMGDPRMEHCYLC